MVGAGSQMTMKALEQLPGSADITPGRDQEMKAVDC